MKNLTSKQQSIISDIFKELKPKPKTNTLEFSKTHGYLSAESSAITGRFVPFAYQEDILRDTSDDDIELLVWMKSTRVGYTKIVNFSVAYDIVEDPCPQIIFQPNDSKAGEWSKKELKPLLRDIPYVGDKIIKTREENNLNYKAYPGGFIESRGGKSANNYASATAKKIRLDEYDRFPDDVDGEGDPYELAKKRTESYWNGQVMIGSTPTIKYHSKIEAKFNETDKRFRYLPCPKCNHYQILEFKNLIIPQEYRDGVKHWHTQDTKMKCENCEELISHDFKKQMDKKGKWRQTKEFYCCERWQNPKDNRVWNDNGEALCVDCGLTAEYNRKGRKKRGYHIWAGYSHQPNTTWEKIADTFVDSLNDVEKMKSFKNTWLAETWEEKSIKINTNDLMNNAEDYENIPNSAKILLMTVDTQDDRLEYLIKSWSDGETSHNIRSGIIKGDPINAHVWDELLRISNETFNRDDGKKVTIYKSFIDIGGHKTDEVKNFVKKHSNKFIMLKGDSREIKTNDSRPLATLKTTEKDNSLIMWVATTKAKDIIFKRLSLDVEDDGFIHHNRSFNEEWFNQLTAEKKVFKKNKRGFLEQTYIKTRDRNEALDLEVYSLAAVRLMQQQIKSFDLSKKE